MHRIEGVIDSRYFIAPALLFSTQVRMGKKTCHVFKNCKSNNLQYNFHSYFLLVIYESRWEKDMTYVALSVNPEPLNANVIFFWKERFIF